MSNTFECESASEIVKLLQITDPHLFKDTSKELLGINTHESFSQVLKEIQAESFDYDVVLGHQQCLHAVRVAPPEDLPAARGRCVAR